MDCIRVVTQRTKRFDGRSYLFYDTATKKGALVDPDCGTQELWEYALAEGITVEWILITHGHFDHIGALKEAKDATQGVICVSAADAIKLIDNAENMSHGSEKRILRIPADRLVGEGDVLPLDSQVIRVLATHGHTPGCLCFLCGLCLFTGDTLFSDTVGTTRFPGGNVRQLHQSVDRLLQFDGNIRIFPGHGDNALLSDVKANLALLRWPE